MAEGGNSMEQATESLAAQMIQGDIQAFDQLMERFYQKLLRMAYLISGSYADSEDIVQETFVICWANRGRIRDPKHFSSWLYKTMTREAWRYCKKSRREQPMEEVFGEQEPGGSSLLEEVVARSRDQELYEAIKKLPVKQRTAVILYYFNELSTKEAAAVMGCLEGTVKSRLYTAREYLKKELSGSIAT